MNIVIAPDSFKGCLDAASVSAAMAAGIRRVWPDAVIRQCPMADGGEGTRAVIESGREGRREWLTVSDAEGNPVEVPVFVFDEAGRRSAALDVADVVGLPKVTTSQVRDRTTRGVGQALRAVLTLGVDQVLVGLGGSSTNDGGVGLLAALGARFLDAAGQPVEASLAGLDGLCSVDMTGLDERLANTGLVLLTDVDNGLLGPSGATAVFGPQKGVQPAQIDAVDQLLARWARLGDNWFGCALSTEPGTGAAGGLGYALRLVGGRVESGALVLARLQGLPDALREADWVLTGEGRSDAQTMAGKVAWRIAAMAQAQGVPVTLLSGALDRYALPQLSRHFAGCFALADGPMSLDAAMADAPRLLANQAEQIARLWAGVLHGS